MDTDGLRLFVQAAELLDISAAGRKFGMAPAGAGAAPLAALLSEKDRYRSGGGAVVLCGANVDTEVFASVLSGHTLRVNEEFDVERIGCRLLNSSGAVLQIFPSSALLHGHRTSLRRPRATSAKRTTTGHHVR